MVDSSLSSARRKEHSKFNRSHMQHRKSNPIRASPLLSAPQWPFLDGEAKMIAHGSASGTAAQPLRPVGPTPASPRPPGSGRRPLLPSPSRRVRARELAAPAHAHMSCARPPRPAHARLPPLPRISAAAPAFVVGGLLEGQKARVSRASRAVRRGQGDRAANLVGRVTSQH